MRYELSPNYVPLSPLPLKVGAMFPVPSAAHENDVLLAVLLQDMCVECDGQVYAMEKVVAGSSTYHKWCFRCAHCNHVLRCMAIDASTYHKLTL